jgi:hypothetical protein
MFEQQCRYHPAFTEYYCPYCEDDNKRRKLDNKKLQKLATKYRPPDEFLNSKQEKPF